MTQGLIAAPARVLVVDDTSDLRDLLRLALERNGFVVVAEAGDGRQGIKAAREQQPDLVLLDLAMPVMDGLEALPLLRGVCPNARIVVLSGFGADTMTRRALEAGADGYLQKGAPLKTIISYLDQVLDTAPTGRPSSPSTPSAQGSHPQGGPTAPTVPRPDPVGSGQTGEGSRVISEAPFGVVEVADQPGLPLVAHNPAADRLLGPAPGDSGVPLARWCADLADLVGARRLRQGGDFRATLRTATDEVTVAGRVRRLGAVWVVYLVPPGPGDDVVEQRLAVAVHELRAPAAAISTLLAALEEEPDEGRRAHLLAAVRRQARLLDHVSADVLTSAEAGRGPLRLVRTRCDLASLAREVISQQEAVQLQVSDPRPADVDPGRIEQLLANLLANAVKHGAPPFTVRIRAAGPERIALEVEDRGRGIPDHLRHRVFDAFVRGDAAAPGNGIGLSVVRSIAEAHDGSASYAPAEDGGSVFTVTLPAAP